MGRKKSDLTPEESELFRKMVQDARPLKQEKAEVEKPKKSVSKRQIITIEATHSEESSHFLEKIDSAHWLDADTPMYFARNGISHRVQHQLKRGHIPVEGRLDLHRLTGNQALHKTAQFLKMAVESKKRCVLIVHGKGGKEKPVIKNLMNQWLREQTSVLAFATTKPYHGGSGALYVLLKNKKSERHEE